MLNVTGSERNSWNDLETSATAWKYPSSFKSEMEANKTLLKDAFELMKSKLHLSAFKVYCIFWYLKNSQLCSNVLSFFTQCCNHKGVFFFAFYWFYIPMPSTKGLFILFNLANIGSYFKQGYASQTSAKKCHILCKNRGDVVKLFKKYSGILSTWLHDSNALRICFLTYLGFLQKQSSTIDRNCQK